jgi:hypothetical protein
MAKSKTDPTTNYFYMPPVVIPPLPTSTIPIPLFELYEEYSVSLESIRSGKPIIKHRYGPWYKPRYYYIYA